jgi:cytochrome d ubiquinol oxidase subunit II
MVSIWTPCIEPQIYRRWFAWLSPVPVITLALFVWLLRSLQLKRDVAPFLAALGLFGMCYLGLGISIVPMIVPYTTTFWAAASSPKSQGFLIIGTLFLLPIIVMYTGWSYWVFGGKVKAGAGYH